MGKKMVIITEGPLRGARAIVLRTNISTLNLELVDDLSSIWKAGDRLNVARWDATEAEPLDPRGPIHYWVPVTLLALCRRASGGVSGRPEQVASTWRRSGRLRRGARC